MLNSARSVMSFRVLLVVGCCAPNYPMRTMVEVSMAALTVSKTSAAGVREINACFRPGVSSRKLVVFFNR
jgi:hypothetical protein